MKLADQHDYITYLLFQGKVLDKSEFLESLNSGGATTDRGNERGGGGARLRSKPAPARARPKTIHVDSGALHQAEGLRAKQPSSTNLTGQSGGGRWETLKRRS